MVLVWKSAETLKRLICHAALVLASVFFLSLWEGFFLLYQWAACGVVKVPLSARPFGKYYGWTVKCYML
jgi:hypothetical protein